MEIMIEALRQEAMRAARSDVLTSDAGTPQKIEVGAAFRPQAAVPEVAVDPTVVDPRCDVQSCEYDSVPNLRLALLKYCFFTRNTSPAPPFLVAKIPPA